MYFREVGGRRHVTFSEDVNNRINIFKALILENGSYNVIGVKLIEDTETDLDLGTSLLSTRCSVKGPEYLAYQGSSVKSGPQCNLELNKDLV